MIFWCTFFKRFRSFSFVNIAGVPEHMGTRGHVSTIFWNKALRMSYFWILSQPSLRQNFFVPSIFKWVSAPLYRVCRQSKLEVSRKSWPHSNQSARIQERPGSNHSLMAGNFVALWPTDSKSLALKDLYQLKTVSKLQEASSTLEAAFTLSKWPHLHRADLLASCLNWPALYPKTHSWGW